MNLIIRLLLIFFYVNVFWQPAYGQDEKVKIEVPEIICTGNEFSLSFSIDKEATGITLEERAITGLKVTSGPGISTYNNVSIINGTIIRNTTTKFSYSLIAEHEGVFNFPIATITAGGSKYVSEPVLIKVVAADSCKILKPESETPDVFLKLDFNQTKAYKQEPIIADLNIYYKTNLTSIDNVTIPPFDDFLYYELDTQDTFKQEKDTIGDEIYKFVRVRRLLLIPLKPGVHRVGEVKVTCRLRNNSSSMAEFFSSTTTGEVTLYSDPINITVEDFPANKPEDFKYISGSDLKISVTCEKSVIIQNEPFNLELNVSGNGNLKLLEIPEINLPPHIKLLKADYINKLTTGINGVYGIRTFIYTLLPETNGNFEIPAYTFSYFNIDKAGYERISSPVVRLEVSGNDSTVSSPQTVSEPDKISPDRKETRLATMILLDVSESMLAQDFEPNRKTAVINEVSNFINSGKHEIGIILYSAIPVLLHQPTNEKVGLTDALKNIDQIRLGNGTATGLGILMAVDKIRNTDSKYRNIVLVTDGASNISSISNKLAAEISAIFNIRLFIVGISGNMESAPYTFYSEYGEHKTVVPITINDDVMKDLAAGTGGLYFRASDTSGLHKAFREINKVIRKRMPSGTFNLETTYAASEIESIINLVYQDIEEQGL